MPSSVRIRQTQTRGLNVVLVEKTVPAGHWFAYATGIVLLIWGAGMLVNAL